MSFLVTAIAPLGIPPPPSLSRPPRVSPPCLIRTRQNSRVFSAMSPRLVRCGLSARRERVAMGAAFGVRRNAPRHVVPAHVTILKALSLYTRTPMWMRRGDTTETNGEFCLVQMRQRTRQSGGRDKIPRCDVFATIKSGSTDRIGADASDGHASGDRRRSAPSTPSVALARRAAPSADATPQNGRRRASVSDLRTIDAEGAP